MVRLPMVERLPEGKAWELAKLVEAKRGGQCGWRKGLREGQEHPGKTGEEPTGKAEGKGTTFI